MGNEHQHVFPGKNIPHWMERIYMDYDDLFLCSYSSEGIPGKPHRKESGETGLWRAFTGRLSPVCPNPFSGLRHLFHVAQPSGGVQGLAGGLYSPGRGGYGGHDSRNLYSGTREGEGILFLDEGLSIRTNHSLCRRLGDRE